MITGEGKSLQKRVNTGGGVMPQGGGGNERPKHLDGGRGWNVNEVGID